MPQAAQQDYIKNAVYIADAENVTDDEKRALWEYVERETIWDVLVVVGIVETRVTAVDKENKFVVLAWEPQTQESVVVNCEIEE